ncbi:ATP-binding protein [Halopseudomonas pachastrellae]|nr:ATP-binding protein [Halopseudomonas pachastrellae]
MIACCHWPGREAAALEQTETIDLAEIAAIELEAKRSLAERKNLTLALETDADCRLAGDRFLLEQAISNLLDNAIEFSLPGGTVAIQIGASDTALSLRVRNDGPAVPDYALGRVFERFYSLPRPDGQRKSTGLGLSFVREIARLHRGRVSLYNRKEGGVEVEMQLDREAQTGEGHPSPV